MAHPLGFALAAATASVCLAQPPAAPHKPTLADRADLGQVCTRSVHWRTFEIRNDSTKPWTLSRPAPDCTCISGAIDHPELPPGQTAKVQLQVAVGVRAGHQSHIVSVAGQTDAGPHTWDYELTFDALPVLLWPSMADMVDLGDLPVEGLPSRKVFTIKRGPFPLKFDGLTAEIDSPDAIQATVETSGADQWTVSVQVDPSKRLGPVRGRLRLTPTLAGQPACKSDDRHLYGAITGPVSLAPRSILIGVAHPGQVFQRAITTASKEPVSLLAVEPREGPAPQVLEDGSTLRLIAPAADGPVECDVVFTAGAYEVRVPVAMKVQTGKVAAPSELQSCIDAWQQGRRDEALGALQSAPWSDPEVEFTASLLRMSESQFVALSQSERERLEAEALTLTEQLRAMADAALERADQLARSGDTRAAMRLRSGVKGLGDRLADPKRRLAIFNLIGKSLSSRAAASNPPQTRR